MFLEQYQKDFFSLIQDIDSVSLIEVAKKLQDVNRRGGNIFVVGNGGSAGIASHVAVDLSKAAGLRATTFHDSGLITCFANDYGYENWIGEAVVKYCDAKDALICISSSGNSLNILNGARAASSLGCGIISLSGFDADNLLRSEAKSHWDHFYVASSRYNHVEMVHQYILLTICDWIVNEKTS
jgi:D-sedoheptulose 7-phosphate isomerase